jgi:Transposase and inactivated derivatives
MDERIEFFIGLDAHKESTSVAVCEATREAARFAGTIGPDVRVLLKLLAKAGDPAQVSVVYEAGPTGYGLYRELRQRGYQCGGGGALVDPVPPYRPGDRVKNDRRDCARLAELSRAGELKAIWYPMPDEAHEALRNLWRAREDAVNMRLKTRQQLKAFLLRQNRRHPGKTSWTRSRSAASIPLLKRVCRLSSCPPIATWTRSFTA